MGYYRNNLKVERDNVTGVGGLLWQTTSAGVRAFPFYDGNGNICGYTDASGVVQTRYLYDGFLNVTQTGSGSYRYQASTKSWNPALGLLEYQFRAYSPEIGRWIQEDPIEEKGGRNLYCFVKNNPIENIDIYGDRDYKIGTDDPVITHDAGAGKWNSESPEFSLRVARYMILMKPMSLSLPDAYAHLRHYIGGTGSTYTIRFDNLLDTTGNGKEVRLLEIYYAKQFAETLPDGTYDITSGAASQGYIQESDSSNWYYGVAGYAAWGKGRLVVSGKSTCFSLDFELKFEDKYNWDKGKDVYIFGIQITDDLMGSFHRQGLAKEFLMVGSHHEHLEWTKSGTKNAQSPNSSGGDR